MNTTERMLVGGFFLIAIAIFGWLLDRVVIDTGRIAVLEQRTANHVIEMSLIKQELRDHRIITEPKGSGH